MKNDSRRIFINYGLILGITSIIVAMCNYLIGNPYKPHWSISIISLILTTTVIILGLNKLKAIQDGYISLKEALKTGLGIALISGIIYVVFQLILTTFIDTEFYVNMIEIQKAEMIEKYPDFTDEQIEQSLAIAEKFSSPWVTSAFTLVGSLFIGFIISLIGGLIIKNENPYNELDEL